MKKILFILCFLACASWLFAGEIPDADISDNGDAIRSEKKLLEAETTKSSLETSFRAYALTAFDYMKLKTKESAVPDSGFFPERSGRAELSMDWSVKLPGYWVLRSDVQGHFSSLFAEEVSIFPRGNNDWLRLNEFFMEFFFTDKFSLLLGKNRNLFGPGFYQNPLDRLTPIAVLPGQPVQREGVYLAQLNFFIPEVSFALKDLRFSVGFVPGFLTDKQGIPVTESAEITQLTWPMPALVRSEREYDFARERGAFLRISSQLAGGDLNLLAYYLESQPQGGLSYARYFGTHFEMHGEILFYREDRYQDLLARQKDFFVDGIAGIKLEKDQDIGIILEYLFRDDQPWIYPTEPLKRQALMARIFNTRNKVQYSSPLRQYLILTAYVREIRDRYDFSLSVLYNPQDLDRSFTFKAEARPDSHARITLSASVMRGETGSFYDSFIPMDYRLGMELSVTF